MKSREYLKYFIYSLCIFIAIMGLLFNFIITIASLLLLICFVEYEKYYTKSLRYFIRCCDDIIENKEKHIEIIDGEGDISLLSHKLYILNERFYTLLDDINNEKIILKDYIDDISHQLKTPITSMKINEEILIKKITDELQKKIVENIYIQTNHMSNLVNSLLTLAKLDAGSIRYDIKTYEFKTIIDNVEDILTPLLIRHEVELINHFDDIHIHCDFNWMSEAIENIIKNCIEASPHRNINIYANHTESSLIIQIHDHGKGIDHDDINHIFERFYKGKNSSPSSVGIGLSLSQKIIEAHYGYIEVSNDNGAIFTIHLPIISIKKKF